MAGVHPLANKFYSATSGISTLGIQARSASECTNSMHVHLLALRACIRYRSDAVKLDASRECRQPALPALFQLRGGQTQFILDRFFDGHAFRQFVQQTPDSQETIRLVEVGDQTVRLLIAECRHVGVATLEGAIEAGERDQAMVTQCDLQVPQVWIAD